MSQRPLKLVEMMLIVSYTKTLFSSKDCILELYFFSAIWHTHFNPPFNLATKSWSTYELFLGCRQNFFIICFSTTRGFTRFFSHSCSGTILQICRILGFSVVVVVVSRKFRLLLGNIWRFCWRRDK